LKPFISIQMFLSSIHILKTASCFLENSNLYLHSYHGQNEIKMFMHKNLHYLSLKL